MEETNVIMGMIALSMSTESVGSAIASNPLNRRAKALMIVPPQNPHLVRAVESQHVMITLINAMSAQMMSVSIADKHARIVAIGFAVGT